MAAPLRITLPHELGRIEARRRIDTGLSNLARQLPGGATVHDQRWDGNRLDFRLAALGRTVSGQVEVLDTSVTIDIELPGLLGKIVGAFTDRLRQAGQLLLTRR